MKTDLVFSHRTTRSKENIPKYPLGKGIFPKIDFTRLFDDFESMSSCKI